VIAFIAAWSSAAFRWASGHAPWPRQVAAFAAVVAGLPAGDDRALARRPEHPRQVSLLVLPLAVALFHMTGPAANLGVVLFLADLAWSPA
jgi:hypothetical protein